MQNFVVDEEEEKEEEEMGEEKKDICTNYISACIIKRCKRKVAKKKGCTKGNYLSPLTWVSFILDLHEIIKQIKNIKISQMNIKNIGILFFFKLPDNTKQCETLVFYK